MRPAPAATARLQRPAKRPPFELHPEAPFERIKVLVEAVARRRHERQRVLNTMEQPVTPHLLASLGILLRKHVQGHGEPSQPAPFDGAVREAETGYRPVGFRLVCGTRSGRWVNDHQRTTERHTPQPARVSLAQLRGLFEIAFCELWFDLALPQPLRRRPARRRIAP